MRILQVVPSVSLVYGGPSQMILGLSKALANEGVKLTLITTDANGDTGEDPLDVPLGIPIQQDGYEIIYFRCSPFRRYKFSLGLLKWLFIHSKEYDLAHIHALFSPVSSFAAMLARWRKLPYILRPLGTLDPADLRKKKKLKEIYASFLEKPNLKGASAIHFTSQQECEVSARFGVKTRDLVIPLGVNLPDQLPIKGKIREQLGIAQDIPLLLFMSRIDPKKGLDLLIPTLNELLAKGCQFWFVLAGSNPQDRIYEQKIKAEIENSELANYTTITGFVQGEMKLGLLQDADLFVLPSYYENFGIAVAEAMVMGTPVLISNQVYIWQDIEKAKAGWVCQCNVESLTEFLYVALLEAEERTKRAKQARHLALEKYSWNAVAKQMIQAYQNIL